MSSNTSSVVFGTAQPVLRIEDVPPGACVRVRQRADEFALVFIRHADGHLTWHNIRASEGKFYVGKRIGLEL